MFKRYEGHHIFWATDGIEVLSDGVNALSKISGLKPWKDQLYSDRPALHGSRSSRLALEAKRGCSLECQHRRLGQIFRNAPITDQFSARVYW